MPCCFRSSANKAAGFTSVFDGAVVVVETLARLLKIALKKASSSWIIPDVGEVFVFASSIKIERALIKPANPKIKVNDLIYKLILHFKYFFSISLIELTISYK